MKLKEKMEFTIGKDLNNLRDRVYSWEMIEEETGYTEKEAKYYIFAWKTINKMREYELIGSLPRRWNYLRPEDFQITKDDIIDYLKRTKQYSEVDETKVDSWYERAGIAFGNWLNEDDE